MSEACDFIVYALKQTNYEKTLAVGFGNENF